MAGRGSERRKIEKVVVRRYPLRILLSVCLLMMGVIYLALLREQNQAINPSILRHNLMEKGQILELSDWIVQFRHCEKKMPRGCISTGPAVSVPLPARDNLTQIVTNFSKRPNIAIISHPLNSEERAWIQRHEFLRLIMPRMVHNYTIASNLSPNSSTVGFGANISFPLQSNQLTGENPLTFEIDFTGYDWFGPADLPIVLAESNAIAAYESLSSLSLSSTFLTKQLDIGLPLVISGMALILDHSRVFPSLAALSAVRALRSYRAFDSEQESPLLNRWQSQLILLLVNILAIPLLLFFITIIADIKVGTKLSMTTIGISALSVGIYAYMSPSYEYESDLWLDLIGCLLSLPLTLLGGYRQLRSQANSATKGPHMDWRQRDAKKFQIIATYSLMLFALISTGYANNIDLLNISKLDFKQNIHWGHTILIPMFIIIAMIDIGSITRKMRNFAKSMVERALIDRDLNVGKRMQSLLLPPKIGTSSCWQWRTFHYPSMTLAGDWFDVRKITTSNNSDYILCCVVDVTGHGVSAALISTAISSHWSMWCQSKMGKEGPSNDKEREKLVLEAPSYVHESLMVLRENSGCTAAFLALEEKTGRISYCTAGHPGIIVFSEAIGLKYLFTPGTRPGFRDSQVGWTARSDSTEIGDLFFVYSDGVVPPQLSFSVWLKRLSMKAKQDGGLLAKALVNDMRRNKSEFRKNRNSEDDMSLVILKRIA